MNRRQMIKTVGAGAGVVALGSGVAPPLSSTATVQATGPCVEAVTGIGWWSGLRSYPNSVAECLDNETGDVDEDEELSEQIWLAADSVSDGREDFETEINAQYASAQSSPYANKAWSEIRVRVAQARLEGKSESEATDEASQALDIQTARSVINTVEKWNSGIAALDEQIGYTIDEGLNGTLYWDTNYDTILTRRSPSDDWVTGVSGTGDGSGNYFFHKTDVTLPTSLDNLDDREEELKMILPQWDNTEQTVDGVVGVGDGTMQFFDDNLDPEQYALIASDNDLGTITVIDPQLYYDVLNAIDTAYSNIKNDLSDYVSTLYDSFEEGTLDPATIISPQDLYDQFATAPEQQRMTAELLAVGAAHPGGNVGYRAKVSHSDLQDPPQWGVLYPLWAEGTTEKTIESGLTIPASEYKMAYLGFEAADTGEWTVRLLDSGSGDLEILETEDTDDDIISDREDQTAGTNGKVTVWDTAPVEEGGHGESPDPLKYPNDHGDWFIEIRGAQNLSTHAMTEPNIEQGDNGQDVYVLDSTGLNEGELIESVALKGKATYTQTSRYVSDPTTIDSEELEKQLQIYQDLKEAIEQLESGIGGGGFFDGGLPSLPGLGFIESVIVVILAIFGLNAASG